MVIYTLLYINIEIYVEFILTFKLLNCFIISATLACNVGLFQRTCLLIHPAAVTPDLVQSSFLWRFIYAYVRSSSLCFVKSEAPFCPNETDFLQSIRESNFLPGFLDLKLRFPFLVYYIYIYIYITLSK